MLKYFLFILLISFNSLSAMDKKPYHHLPDGTFRNPEGSPVRDSSFNWSYKIFNKEKKKLDMNVPTDHVVNKKQVLKNLTKIKINMLKGNKCTSRSQILKKSIN